MAFMRTPRSFTDSDSSHHKKHWMHNGARLVHPSISKEEKFSFLRLFSGR